MHVSGQKARRKMDTKEAAIDGILVIDPGVFVSSSNFGAILSSGEAALWGFIACLHEATNSLKQNTPQPYEYVV